MTTHEMQSKSFLWSEIRLVIAALSLFVGGLPIVYLILPASIYGLTRVLLTIAWIVSGVASCYLLYGWHKAGYTLFGHKNSTDMFAFLVMIISGINLGITGIFSSNIGMTISSNRIIFDLVGIIYLWTAWYLWRKWSVNGRRFF